MTGRSSTTVRLERGGRRGVAGGGGKQLKGGARDVSRLEPQVCFFFFQISFSLFCTYECLFRYINLQDYEPDSRRRCVSSLGPKGVVDIFWAICHRLRLESNSRFIFHFNLFSCILYINNPELGKKKTQQHHTNGRDVIRLDPFGKQSSQVIYNCIVKINCISQSDHRSVTICDAGDSV